MQPVSIRFEHGLGDCANFAHLVALYESRNVHLNIKCTPDKSILFRIAGADVTHEAVSSSHPWPHGNGASRSAGHYWLCNKTGNNISRFPLPNIGTRKELWEPLVELRCDVSSHISEKAKAEINAWTASLPRPLILLHTKGNTGGGSKNLPDDVTRELYKSLLDTTEGTLILLDWDNRVPRMASYRIRHLTDDFRGCSTEELLVLLDVADLLVGIDSGPLHLARFTNTKSVGIWTRHNPVDFVLPRPELLNLVLRTGCGASTLNSRIPFNIVEQPDGTQFDPEFLADCCSRMLDPTRYLDPQLPAADAQLQLYVDDYARGVAGNLSSFADRHLSFDAMLAESRKRYQAINMVETGTIRAEEDWSGAGYSTFLFGAYCYRTGGKLTSIDINPVNCEFSRSKTAVFGDAVEVIQGASVDVLKKYRQPIDLLYLDSMDTHLPEHADVCLDELKTAYHLLHDKSIVAIDDTPWSKGHFTGKGAKAVPWLLEKKWRIRYAGYQTVLVREGD